MEIFFEYGRIIGHVGKLKKNRNRLVLCSPIFGYVNSLQRLRSGLSFFVLPEKDSPTFVFVCVFFSSIGGFPNTRQPRHRKWEYLHHLDPFSQVQLEYYLRFCMRLSDLTKCKPQLIVTNVMNQHGYLTYSELKNQHTWASNSQSS